MRRRAFLQQAGLVVAAGGTVGGAHALDATGDRESPDPHRAARVLITAAENPLATRLAEVLAERRPVRLSARTPIASDFDLVPSALEADEKTAELVRDVGVIVHGLDPPEPLPLPERIDRQTRGTYNLLSAAAAAGVGGVVYVSDLGIMAEYPPELIVDEDFQPAPRPDSPALAAWLGEVACREFAREKRLAVAVLRLAELADAESAAGRPPERPWIDPRDAAAAVALAVAALGGEQRALGDWSVFHIASAAVEARIPLTRARQRLGFHPQYPT